MESIRSKETFQAQKEKSVASGSAPASGSSHRVRNVEMCDPHVSGVRRHHSLIAMTSWRCSCIRPDKRDGLSTYYTEQPCRTQSTKVPFLMSRRLRASSEQSFGIESMRCRLLIPRRAQHETTAAHAQAEAPNAHVAHEVEENAEHLQQAATKAAQAAQVSCVHPSRRKLTYTLQPVGNGV